MGVGASSIMFIIVVVCLTLFSVLALVTARNDAALTDRIIAGTEAYYQADSAGQKFLSELDYALKSGDPAELEAVTAFYRLSAGADGTLSCTLPADDGHALLVEVSVADTSYTVTGYRYVNTQDWDSGASLNVLQ